MKHLIVIFITVFILTACTPQHQLQSNSLMKQIPDNNASQGSRKSIQGEIESDKDEGVYILEDGKIYIKTNGRSLTSIIDELAFKMRFNYLISTPLPKNRLAIYDRNHKADKWSEQKGMVFDSIQDVFDFLEQFMNYVSKNKKITHYKIILNDDGIVIKSNIKDYKSSYKKIFLYNLTVDEAQKSLKEFFFKEDASGYSMLPLPAQNAIIVRANQEILNQIGEIIYSIDSDSPQVMLEAEVFEYDDTVGRKIGMAIDYANINGDFVLGVKTIFGEGVSSLMPQITGSYTNEEKKKTLLTSLALQDRNGGVKILSEPRVVLKPGKEASLRLNTEKYVIVSGVNDSKLEKIETGIVFKIVPIILSKSTILLKLHLEQSEFIPTNEDQIVQSSIKNLIDTSIVVNDGELISLGGIYLSKKSKFDSGVPVLKDIPGIGQAFSSNSEDSSRTMIEFMIRPTIKKLNSRLRKIKQNTYRMFYQEYH
jgi:type II secretory pathway component GspD/PulD (secretin)